MFRDILTNKWVLGGVGFLIVLSIACVLWYQHDTADERKAAAETEEQLRQWELSQETDTEQVGDVAPAESETLTVDKPVIETTAEVVERTTDNETPSPSTKQTEDSEKTEVLKVSPHGFGAYPEVPEGFPTNISVPWLYPERTFDANLELAIRVLIKLWNQGDTQILGAVCTDDQKVYPYYPNTVYVEYAELEIKDGVTIRTISHFFGPPGLPEITDEMVISGVIPGVRLINVEEGAIDALQILNFK